MMIELTYVQFIGVCLGVCALSVAVMLIWFRDDVRKMSKLLSAKELEIEWLNEVIAHLQKGDKK